MSNDPINNMITATYNNNMRFLQTKHPQLYTKLRLFESNIDSKIYSAQYELTFKETHFDVYHKKKSTFLYNQDSNTYSKNLLAQIISKNTDNNFQPYIPLEFNDDFMKEIDKKDIMSDDLSAAAPIIKYINKHQRNNSLTAQSSKFIFFGVGLGLQIAKLHNTLNCKVYLICEPDLELFRLSLFTMDYSELSQYSTLFFSVADSDEEFKEKCSQFLREKYLLNYIIKYNIFSLKAAYLSKLFQSTVATQSFITYNYTRCFMASVRPLQYSKMKSDFLDVSLNKNRSSVLSNHPILILGAGSSLMKNIDWLKENQSKFIIITIASHLKILYKYNIKPDVIIHIDENEKINLNNLEVDMDFFKEALVIFSSITHPQVAKKFDNNSKFVIQAIANYYVDLYLLFSMSVGETAYGFALHYGSKEIYLLGLDFSLDPITHQSHAQGYSANTVHKDVENKLNADEIDLYKNYLRVKGNLRDTVFTTTAWSASISEFNYFTQGLTSKEVMVYNLSDGAYLEHTNPADINALNTNEFTFLNKSDIRKKFQTELLHNSRNSLNSYDKKILKRKLKNAKYIKQLSKLQLAKTDYKNTEYFLKDLEELIYKISLGEDKTDSTELNRILFEYTRLTGHYLYDFCERQSSQSDALMHIPSINVIYITQLLKITDKYIDAVQNYISQI